MNSYIRVFTVFSLICIGLCGDSLFGADAPRWTLIRDVDCCTEAPIAEIGTSKITDGFAGKYRQAGSNLNDRFAYLFKLTGGGRLVRLTVDYPDDAVRLMLVSPSFPRWPDQDAAGMEMQPLGSGFISGLMYRPSNKMVQREFVFYSPEPELCIVLQTGFADQPAAAARLKLEEAEPGESFGPPTAAPGLGASLHRHVGLYWEDPVLPQNFSGWAGTDPAKFDQAFTRACDYLQWSGQDLFVYPVIWYSRALYQSKLPSGGYKWPHGLRYHPADVHKRMAAECSARGLKFLAAINTWKFPNLMPLLLPKEKVIAGEPSIVTVDKAGNMLWNDSWSTPPLMNILHPIVQAEALGEVDELCADLGAEASWSGIQLQMWNINPWGVGRELAVSYDDWTIGEFCKDKGLKPPGAVPNPERFQQRSQWILDDPARKAMWIEWRCDRMTAFYKTVAARIAKAHPGAKLYLNIVYPAPIAMDLGDPAEQVRENGFDLAALTHDPNIVIDRGVGQLGARARLRKPIWPVFDQYDLSSWFQAPFEGLPQCAVTMHQQYFESHPQVRDPDMMLKLPPPWTIEGHGRCCQPLPTGRYFLAYYARAMQLFDPQSIAAGGFDVGTEGAEAEIREFGSAFRALPAVKFRHVDGNGDVILRTADAEGFRWFYAVNVTDTQTPLTLNVTGGRLDDAVNGEEMTRKDGKVNVLLKPFELLAWRGAKNITLRLND